MSTHMAQEQDRTPDTPVARQGLERCPEGYMNSPKGKSPVLPIPCKETKHGIKQNLLSGQRFTTPEFINLDHLAQPW